MTKLEEMESDEYTEIPWQTKPLPLYQLKNMNEMPETSVFCYGDTPGSR
jgi:hypothetical protein